jgi:tripartite-type tricarboxylate transporter receptor subunit TctC
MKRCIACLAALLLPFAVCAGELPNGYPSKPVRLIVPYVAGASFDTIARLVTQPLGETLNQQIVVDNRPGATGIIGAELVAHAAPDGYTMGLFGGNQTLSQAVRKELPYDMLKDYAPVTRVATLDNVLVVNPSLKVKTLAELTSLLKAHPGKYYYGSGGVGGDTHFAGALFQVLAGVNIVHVPYKGGGLAVTGLVANEVQIMVCNMISAEPQVKAGRLTALAVAAPQRSKALPEVPTSAEAGLPGLIWQQWYGFFLPAHAPAAMVKGLNEELGRIVVREDVRAKLERQGARPMHETPQQLYAFVRDSIAQSKRIAAQAHIAVQQ